jgi:hypothetical protein
MINSILLGEPVWVVTSVSQSGGAGTGAVTFSTDVLGVAGTEEEASDLLDLLTPHLACGVMDVKIEEAILLN